MSRGADTLSDDELRAAYAACRAASWADYPTELGDPTRRALVEACALGRRHPAPAERATPQPVRLGRAAPRPAPWPLRRVTPADLVDQKRLAAGDRDD